MRPPRPGLALCGLAFLLIRPITLPVLAQDLKRLDDQHEHAPSGQSATSAEAALACIHKPAACGEQISIVNGFTCLDTSGPHPGLYYDLLDLDLRSGQVVRVDLSTNTDTNTYAFVELYDPSGSLVGIGPVGVPIGGVSDSIINYTATVSGTYTIRPNSRYQSVYTWSVTCSSSAGLPNLVPYQPPGWSDKIVVSTAQGSHVDTPSLTSSDTLYISWGEENIGAGDTPPGVRRYTELFIDGVSKTRGYSDSVLMSGGYYEWWDYYSNPPLGPGTHTLRLVVDSTNVVAESNETDNQYSKTISVGGGSPPPAPCSPSVRVVPSR